jgi:hypothetical protein|tara:strand:- start:443 stop:679 length:237 start_codon:yes stop_codon:yes gene_type:complete
MEKYLRRLLAIIDDNKQNMRDGDYIEMCDNLNKIRKINARERIQKSFRTIIKLAKYTIVTKIGLKILFDKRRGNDNDD